MATAEQCAFVAFDLQKVDDDDRAENVAAIFIEDALRYWGLPNTLANFERVETVVDRMWAKHLKKRA